MAWKDIGEKVVVGVISAVALGALALIWNFTSQGGLVRLIGGVPEQDLSPQLTLLSNKIDTANLALANKFTGLEEKIGDQSVSGADFPSGAVVAFNSTAAKPCPDGWSRFTPAISRVVVGAGHPSNETFGLTPRLSYKDDRSPKKTSALGGEERVAMTKPEMPKHGHGMGSLSVTTNSNFIHRTDHGMSVNANLRVKHGLFSSKSGLANLGGHTHLISGETALIGEGKPHNNMPPYVALYYCKKN